MNNRQAGAYRELVRKEERAREKWLELHGGQMQQQANGTQQAAAAAAMEQTQQLPYWQPALSYGSQSGTYLPSNSGALPLAPSSIYDSALRISSPRLYEEDAASQTRRVVRQVEVPYTRQVKVPVTTQQLVPVLVERKVRTRHLVEEPSTKVVNESYEETVFKPAVRSKDIWVKRTVQEAYQQPVVVRRTRKVTVPSTVLRAVDGYEVVQVHENRAVQVDGYRIDEVQDSKLVETEELHTGGGNPYATGHAQLLSAREVGPVVGFHHSRKIGTEVFHPLDERHFGVEEDNVPFSPQQQQQQMQRSSFGARSQRPASASFVTPAAASASAFGSVAASSLRGTNSVSRSFIGSNTTRLNRLPSVQASDDASIGFRLRDTNSGDIQGVLVYSVAGGLAAERAGVRKDDLITFANNRPTRNLAEYRSVVQNSVGPILLQVRRRGGFKIMLTLHR